MAFVAIRAALATLKLFSVGLLRVPAGPEPLFQRGASARLRGENCPLSTSNPLVVHDYLRVRCSWIYCRQATRELRVLEVLDHDFQ